MVSPGTVAVQWRFARVSKITRAKAPSAENVFAIHPNVYDEIVNYDLVTW
jgi:hypothetical protein